MATPQPFTNAKLEDFHGDGTIDARAWIQRYERFCTRAKFNDETKLQEIYLALKGHAQTWFETEGQTYTDYMTLKEAFLQRFASDDEHQIPRIKQYSEETVDDYYSRFIAKSRHCRLDECYKVTLFIEGLSEKLASHVFMSAPKTLIDARRIALRAEQANFQHPTPNISSVEQRNTELEKMVMDLTSAIQQLQTTHQMTNHSSRQLQQEMNSEQKSYRQRRNFQKQPRESCRHCDGKALNCSFFVNGKCPGKSSTCWGCNQKGHYAKACYRWSSKQ